MKNSIKVLFEEKQEKGSELESGQLQNKSQEKAIESFLNIIDYMKDITKIQKDIKSKSEPFKKSYEELEQYLDSLFNKDTENRIEVARPDAKISFDNKGNIQFIVDNGNSLKTFEELVKTDIFNQIKEMVLKQLDYDNELAESYILNPMNKLIEIEDGILKVRIGNELKDYDNCSKEELRNVVKQYIKETNDINLTAKYYNYLFKYQQELDALKLYNTILEKKTTNESIIEGYKQFLDEANKKGYGNTNVYDIIEKAVEELEEYQKEQDENADEVKNLLKGYETKIIKSFESFQEKTDSLIQNVNEDFKKDIRSEWSPLTEEEILQVKNKTETKEVLEKEKTLYNLNKKYKNNLDNFIRNTQLLKIEFARLKTYDEQNKTGIVKSLLPVYGPRTTTANLFGKLSTILGSLASLDVCEDIVRKTNDIEKDFGRKFKRAQQILNELVKESKKDEDKLEILKKHLLELKGILEKTVDKKQRKLLLTDIECIEKFIQAVVFRSMIEENLETNFEDDCINLKTYLDDLTIDSGGAAYICSKADNYKWNWNPDTLEFKRIISGYREKLTEKAAGSGQALYVIPYNYKHDKKENLTVQENIGENERGSNLRKFRANNIIKTYLNNNKIITGFDVINSDFINLQNTVKKTAKDNASPEQQKAIKYLNRPNLEKTVNDIDITELRNTIKGKNPLIDIFYNITNDTDTAEYYIDTFIRKNGVSFEYETIENFLAVLKDCLENTETNITNETKNKILEKINKKLKDVIYKRDTATYEPLFKDDINDILSDLGVKEEKAPTTVHFSYNMVSSNPIMQMYNKEKDWLLKVKESILNLDSSRYSKMTKNQTKLIKDIENKKEEIAQVIQENIDGLEKQAEYFMKMTKQLLFDILFYGGEQTFPQKPETINIREEMLKMMNRYIDWYESIINETHSIIAKAGYDLIMKLEKDLVLEKEEKANLNFNQ